MQCRNDCIKRFCSDLKELGTKITIYQQKEMILLTNNENRYYEEQKEYCICQKEFCYNKNEKMKIKLCKNVIIQENVGELLIGFVI